MSSIRALKGILCPRGVGGTYVVYVLHCILILSHLVVFIVPDILMVTYFDVHKGHMCLCVYAAQDTVLT